MATPTKQNDLETKLPPPEGVQMDPNGNFDGDPADAEQFAIDNNIPEDQSIVPAFTNAEKEQLRKDIKHGLYNRKEAALLKYLMQQEGDLENIGVMIGAASTRSNGAPVSKQAAKGFLAKIFEKVAKRSKFKLGQEIDLTKFDNYKKEMRERNIKLRQEKARKRKNEAELKKRRAAAMKEFWDLLKELNAEQRKLGLEPTRYDKMMMKTKVDQGAGAYSA